MDRIQSENCDVNVTKMVQNLHDILQTGPKNLINMWTVRVSPICRHSNALRLTAWKRCSNVLEITLKLFYAMRAANGLWWFSIWDRDNYASYYIRLMRPWWGEERANVKRIKKLLLLSKYTLSWYFHTLVSFITVILHCCWAAVQSFTQAQQSIASNGNSFQNVKILIRKTWICITWMHLVPSHTGRLRRTVGSAISSKAVPMHFFH